MNPEQMLLNETTGYLRALNEKQLSLLDFQEIIEIWGL